MNKQIEFELYKTTKSTFVGSQMERPLNTNLLYHFILFTLQFMGLLRWRVDRLVFVTPR